jgi:hypothetical protein
MRSTDDSIGNRTRDLPACSAVSQPAALPCTHLTRRKKYNYACVLYGFESWFLSPREEYRSRVFQNRVLRRIFGSNREEVTRERRKLQNEELSDLCCSSNIARAIK